MAECSAASSVSDRESSKSSPVSSSSHTVPLKHGKSSTRHHCRGHKYKTRKGRKDRGLSAGSDSGSQYSSVSSPHTPPLKSYSKSSRRHHRQRGHRYKVMKQCMRKEKDRRSLSSSSSSSEPPSVSGPRTPKSSTRHHGGQFTLDQLTMNDHNKVTNFLRDLDNDQLIGVGVALGLHYPSLNRMKNILGNMVAAWLREDDDVSKASGSPSWASLATALEDVGHKGIASKIRKGPMQATQTAATSLSPEMSSAFSRYGNYLKSYYNTNPVARDDKLSIAPCSEFISLALVKKDKSISDTFSQSTFYGGRDQISAHKVPLELDAIFTLESKFVLVEGAPGIGKSTLSWELCRKWDTLRSLQCYSIVLLLKLREGRVQNASSLNELFYHDDKALCESVVSEVLRCEGEGVLLILDGFDEMPASVVRNEKNLIMRVISGMCIPRATRLVTSRPSALHHTECFLKIFRHVEIIGFTDKSKENFAEIAFKSEPNVLSEFKKFIFSNPIIKSLMYIPVNCAILAQSYKDIMRDSKQVPKTTTQLYTMLTRILIRRHLIAIERWDKYSKVPSDLKDLPEDVKGDLERVSKLAYTGLFKEDIQLVFTDSDVGEGFHPLGLLSEVKEMYVCEGARTSYSFLHLSIQEFLAAWHVSCHQEELAEGAITKTIDEAKMILNPCSPRFNTFGCILASLIGVSDLYIKHLREWCEGMDDQTEVILYACHCLYEAQSSVSDVFSIFDKYYSVILYTPLDMYMFGYCLACFSFTFPWATVISSIDMLVYSLADHGQLLGSITKLILNVHGKESLSLSCKLRDLPYSLLNSIEDLEILTDLSFLLLEGIPDLPYLQEMTISCTSTSYKQGPFDRLERLENDYLLEFEMCKFSDLKSLKVSAKLSERGACGLIQAMARSSTIEEIELDAHCLCYSDYIFKCRMDSLAQAALSCPSLKYFKTNFPFFIPNNTSSPKNLHSVTLNRMKFSYSELPKLFNCLHSAVHLCKASPLQSVSFQDTIAVPFLPCEAAGGYYDCISLLNTRLHHNWPSLETLKLPYRIPCTQYNLSSLSHALRRDNNISLLKLRRSKSLGDIAYSRPWKEDTQLGTEIFYQCCFPRPSQSCPDLLGIQSLHTSFYGTVIVSRWSRQLFLDDLDMQMINLPLFLFSLNFPTKLYISPHV